MMSYIHLAGICVNLSAMFKEKGAIPIVLSHTPCNMWDNNEIQSVILRLLEMDTGSC